MYVHLVNAKGKEAVCDQKRDFRLCYYSFLNVGSGKTLAYLAPLIHRLREEEERNGVVPRLKRPRSLILLPSRDLAAQVLSVAKSLCHVAKFRAVGLIGGIKRVSNIPYSRNVLREKMSQIGEKSIRYVLNIDGISLIFRQNVTHVEPKQTHMYIV